METLDANRAATARHGVPRVLIVDDELDHAEICAALLRRRGYTVAVAVSGSDAIVLASALKPDLILLDLFMPALDGFATAATLHEHPDTANVPIVFLSACGERDVEPRLAELGGSAYLAKPFRAADLVACVEQSLVRMK